MSQPHRDMGGNVHSPRQLLPLSLPLPVLCLCYCRTVARFPLNQPQTCHPERSNSRTLRVTPVEGPAVAVPLPVLLLPTPNPVISTGGGAFAAAVERPAFRSCRCSCRCLFFPTPPHKRTGTLKAKPFHLLETMDLPNQHLHFPAKNPCQAPNPHISLPIKQIRLAYEFPPTSYT